MENEYHGNIMERAIYFILENYKVQPNLEEIADHVFMSKYHFQRLFRQWVGVTPKQFLQVITVEHAKKCLQEGRSTLATAYEVGLSGNGRLHDMFIKMESCTPGEFQKRGIGLELKYDVIKSPFGEMVIAESEQGICRLSFLLVNSSPKLQIQSDFPEARFVNKLGKYGQMVEEYFRTWKIPKKKIILDLKGTPFQISVWKALLSIPSAQYVAKADIARIMNTSEDLNEIIKAVRANPIAYLIPCHRVIRESGQLGDYIWGNGKHLMINGYEHVKLSHKRIS